LASGTEIAASTSARCGHNDPDPAIGHRRVASKMRRDDRGDNEMATIEEQILDSFYPKVAESKEIERRIVDALRALFQSGKKFKADDVVAILSRAGKEDAL
jgi:hypothetical protein